jgi:hypothetical protein
MDELDLVDVYSVKNPATAEIIKNALEVEGIPCRLENVSQGGLTGIFDVKLLVRAADEARARELIRSHETDDDDEMEDIEVGVEEE